jgi:phosphatidylglycerophosphate synthase
MVVSKQIADLLTLIRALLSIFLAYIGFTRQAEGLPLASWLMIVSWTSDTIDGPLARRSRVQYRTWLGDRDLEVDMLVASGLLVYMAAAGFVSTQIATLYALAWALVFWRWGILRSLGMLFQAPIYGWFLVVALSLAPAVGSWMVGWILAVVVITWPRFPNEVVPGFLSGMVEAWHAVRRSEE